VSRHHAARTLSLPAQRGEWTRAGASGRVGRCCKAVPTRRLRRHPPLRGGTDVPASRACSAHTPD
jgi:hypothetical protein